jgi:acyl-CoA thioesterase II
MKIERYPYRARAWLGEVLAAESDDCLYVEREGEPSVLYFPEEAIDRGMVERDVLTLVSDPPEELGQLRGFGLFDQDRVRLEVVDSREGEGLRDATVKQFPTWGDAMHLIDVMDVRADRRGSFVGVAHSDGTRPVVEGSQMLGQAIVAGGRHVPEHRVVSAHMVFVRPADARRPLRFELEERSRGRTFSALGVQVLQDGRCCGTGTLLLGLVAPELVRHAVGPPVVAGPDECDPYDMGVTGRDVRVADGAYSNDSHAPVGPPIVDAWVRFRDLPTDPVLHAGLLAQFTGHMSIAAALRPHAGVGQDQAHRTLSMGINAINLSLHREVRADDWMLYHHLSTFAGDGMTHSECRVHDVEGDLLASFSVEAMVRPFPAGTGTVDERTAL